MRPLFQKEDYSLRHPVRSARIFFRCLKWSRQRISRGWSDLDAECFCHWFPGVVPEMLLHIQKCDRESSYPETPWDLITAFYRKHESEIGASFEELQLAETPRLKKWQQRCQRESHKEWLRILGAMARGFVQAEEEKDLAKKAEKRAPSFRLMETWFEYLWY
ncbi:MAG: hypothetical protein II776_04805 [Clostridia bacterium]|nr:hypothetical protein [Clostridia bacterium]